MSKKTKATYPEEIALSNESIESKLLRFFLVAEMIWASVNAVLGFLIKLPPAYPAIYGILDVGVLVFFILERSLKNPIVVRRLHFVIVLFTIPVLWYVSGGGETSATILFVCEIILFVMCLGGKRQKIYLVLGLLSVPITQNVSMRLPNPVYPMEPRQYGMAGTILGLSTTLLIASLLLKQKSEYIKERDKSINAKIQLEKSNQLQKNFLANMSHEIRSPLGIVMGFNNLIQESSDINQIHEYSKDITHAGATLLTVINDILDYSKIESGKLDIINEDYSFNTLISDITRDIDLKSKEKGLIFHVETDKSIPDSLHGDNIRIRQCLINVLSNAVKYTETGSVNFTSKCIDKSNNGYTIEFTVSDTGKGIKAESLPNIFTAFQRLDEGMNRGIEGTGLGLAITKNLLDQMGGTITVESELEKGTTFVITLFQKNGSAPAAVAAPAAAADEHTSLSGVKVLAVDDTRLNLILIQKLLSREGVDVTTCTSGAESLELIEKSKYDVILLDHMMPEMNGVEVFNAIRSGNSINAATPIVMLTANAMEGAMREYIDMGFDGYLSKPISQLELKQTVSQLSSKQ